MKARAEELSPGAVRFHHELVALEQNSNGVVARIKNHADGAEYTVRARYLLGCDGGRTVPGWSVSPTRAWVCSPRPRQHMFPPTCRRSREIRMC